MGLGIFSTYALFAHVGQVYLALMSIPWVNQEQLKQELRVTLGESTVPVVVVGPPGVGKTIVVHQVARQLRSEGMFKHIVAYSRNLRTTHIDTPQWASKNPGLPGLFALMAASKNTLFIFDEFDDSSEFTQILAEGRKHLTKGSRIILTSRRDPGDGIVLYLAPSEVPLSPIEVEVLKILQEFGPERTVGELSALSGASSVLTRNSLDGLWTRRMVEVRGDLVRLLPSAEGELGSSDGGGQYVRPEGGGGALYITVDPKSVSSRDIADLLDALNWLYLELGGDELIISNDDVGRFSNARVPV